MRKLIITMLLLAMAGLAALTVSAQNGDVDTGPTSTIDYFAVLCEDRAVIEFSGTMQAGFDIYYQIFAGSGGTGEQLTSLRRVAVSGAYSVSEVATYTGGTLPAGAIGSIYVAIARTNNASDTIFTDFADDLQDGCREPSGPPATGADVDGAGLDGVAPDGTLTDTDRPRGDVFEGRFVSTGTSAILSPFGGYLNPNYIPPDKPLIQIGARDQFTKPRQETPGLVFAECRDYPVAEPGIIYDTDNTIVFWSWFTFTREQMLNHIENVNYSVTYYQVLPLPNPVRSEIRLIGDRYWVFYYSVLGNLLPGDYYIEYKVDWDAPHFDGLDNYGPGTENPELFSGCFFRVLPNPEGRPVSHNPWPYQALGN